MPILKLRLGIPNIPFLFNPDLIGGGVLSVDTSFITIDSDIFRADNHYNLMRGPELITNGIFLTDSNWVTQSGWSISGGTANCDGTANNALRQNFSLPVGTLKIKFDVTARTQGIVNLWINKPAFTQLISANAIGSYEVDVVTTSGANNVFFYSASNFIGSIDNVSVTEDKTFGPELVTNGNFATDSDWTLGNGWSHVDGKASLVQVGSPDAADHLTQQITGLINGRTYVISFDLNITSATTTTIGISSSGAFGQLSSGDRFFTTSGTKTITGVYDSSHQSGTKYLRLVGGNNTAFTIDNVSVKEDRSLNIL